MEETPSSAPLNKFPSPHTYPERSSSLSAADFPHGPPNSPEEGAEIVVQDEDIPALDITSSISRLSIHEQENGNKNPCCLSITELIVPDKKEAFIVAIGGCSSAGKSLLAKILSEIFSYYATTSDSSSPSSKNVELNNGKEKVILITQDDFFLPKSLHPITTFASTPSEAPYMYASLKYDEICNYFITSDGTRPANPPDELSPCAQGSHKYHPRRTDSGSSTSTEASRLFEGGHQPVYRVTGPMPDCDAAIDFVGLVDAIAHVTETGKTPEYKYAPRFPFPSDMAPYAGVITRMRKEVGEWVRDVAITNAEARFGGYLVKSPIENDKDMGGSGKASLRPIVAFVEGFLLLAKPETTPAISGKGKAFDVEAEKRKVLDYTHRLEQIEAELIEEGGIDADLEGERDRIEAQLWATNLAAKRHMQSLFDARIFISLDKEQAKHRRFSRPEYTDSPAGKRLPGQMWKSEGYFEEVVWKQYEKEYEWLLEGAREGEENKGIWIPPYAEMQGGMEEIANWSVDALLNAMGRMESRAREAARGCYGDD